MHYLDGLFNHYGNYCNGLHDDHTGSEFCPEPNLSSPHGVWCSEGVTAYITWGKKINKQLG
ncbi:MAG: hypothetical protein ACJAXH_001456 [Colwellia sp.]|jgi:hypothetical protein